MSRPADPPHSFAVNPQTPTRKLRHQRSLEHVLHFTLTSPQPTRKQAEEADFLYHQILSDCEAAGLTVGRGGSSKVYLHNLFRAIVKFCPTDTGQVNLIRMILHGLFLSDRTTPDDRALLTILPLARAWLNPDHDHQPTYRILETIATDFLEGFFVPLTAQTGCTPHVSEVLTAPSASDVALTQGTPVRLRNLRTLCLLRDGNRCVISGNYDKGFHTRARKLGELPRGTFGVQTQAAHIIPHSLNSVAPGDTLSRPKTFVWQILNMFLPGLSTILEGSLIDTPANAMILASDIHDEFGKLLCYLEEVPDCPNCYTFKTTSGAAELLPGLYPKTEVITLVNHEPEGTRVADLPSACLLKLHAACCKMMEMAGAGEYVERVLEDMERMQEEGTLAGDGSSDIGMVLRMKGLWSERGEMVPDGSSVTEVVVG